MLQTFLRFFWSTPQPPAAIEASATRRMGNVVLYAHVGRHAGRDGAVQNIIPERVSERVNHRERLMSMRLEHTRLCSTRRCDRLRKLGIVTAGDLATADPKRLATQFVAPRKAVRIFQRYRRAIRLAASVPGMMPRDAQLLISIHRRSVRGLALETPAALYRDLQRFAESTSGQQQLRGRRLPSTRRIKRWIAACESYVRNTPVHIPAA